MKKMLSFGFAALFALVGSAEEIESSTITSDIENDYGQNPYGTVCQMSSFLQKTATLKWCSLGTSITWYNDEPRPEVGLTHGYQDRTIEKLGLNKAANFVNRGVSGARIGDANTEPPSGSPCDIYTLEWGINDWMRGTRVGNMEIFRRRLANPNDTCADITTEVWYTFAARYAGVITQIRAINPDAIIILMTPRKAFNKDNNLNNSMREHWWDPSRPDSAQQEATYLYDYVKLIRAIAAETGYPLVDQFRYAANVENLESLSIDKALHPNDAGYEVMANLLAPVMSKAIEEKYGIERCTHAGTTSVVPGTAATCTSDGTTDKTVCTNPDCQMVLVPSETISALGHDWGAWTVTTPATESATGLKRHECSRCDAYEEQVIPRVGEIIALRNIAVVTKVGELPVLPAQVAGLRADGTIAGQCDVVWAEHGAPSAIGKTTITGTATVDNESMTVTASVRATVEQSDDDIKNIVYGVPPTTAYPMSGITYPYASLNATAYANQVNGLYENNSFVWGGALGAAKDGDYNGKYAKEVFVFEFTLANTSTVKGFSVWHMTDSTWLMDPITAFAEVSTDNGATWTSVAVTGGAKPKSITTVPTASSSASVFKYDYELAAPATSVTKLRLKFSPYGIETPEPGDSTNWKGLKISEIEVFGIEGESGGPTEPLTTDTLSALVVDGSAVTGFAPTTLSYTIEEAKVITSATSTDNMGITILPRSNGAAHVVTLSESGSTKTYTVNMPAACEHANTTVTPAVAATCTTAGSTRSVYCEDCKKYLETAETILALGHDWGGWTVTKEPSKTETGYREHTCQRSDCGVKEGEDIPMLADVVALRNVAVATAIGTAPTLPETVKGLNADGTLADGGYSVVWSSFDAPTAAGITTVTGTAQVNGEQMSVTAFVRAAVPPSGELVNIAPLASSMTVGVSQYDWKESDAEGPEVITNGYGNVVMKVNDWNSPGGGYYRNAWKAAHPENTTAIHFVWDSSKSISKVFIAAYEGNSHGDYSLKNGVTGEEIPASSYKCTRGGANYDNDKYYKINQGEGVLVEFSSPMSLSELEVVVVAKGTWLGFYEIEIWAESSAGKVDPTMTDTLTALEVDNQSVTGFEAATCNYTVYNGTEITSATNANGNVAVTVLPKYNGSAYAVTLSETGGQTKTYTVSMPICLHEHTTTNGASAATCTESGSTGTETCDICGAQIHGPEEIPATGHLHTTTTGEKEATCTEDGYTGDTVCSDCKETIASGTVIPKTGHQHTTVTGATDATCTTAGYTGDTVCDDCHETIQTGSAIPALGHDWSAWEITTPPTMTSTGLRERDCSRCDAHESEVIPKLADVVALRNVAVVTTVGTAPTLPGKVAGLKADGTVDGEFEVTWPEVSAPTEPGVTLVTSTSTANGMTVTASVRAATAGGELVNLTETASEGIVKAIKTNTNPEKWLKSVAPLDSNQWNDYIANVQYDQTPNTTELTLGWDSSVTVSEVAIYFNGSGGNYQPPANVKFYDESGDSPTEIAFTAGDVVDSGTVYAHIVYTFSSPKTLSKIRFYATPATDSPARLLFTRRMWVYGPDASAGGSVDPTTTDTLTALEVDNLSVPGFAADTMSYSIEGGQTITKAENDTDNVAVTILQKSVTASDNAYVVTLAEDGESTKTYAISMPPLHEHVFGEWELITPATVYATGLRRRVCTHTGCEVKEEETIPMISRQTVKWIDVDFANYDDESTIANAQVDPVDRGTWAKPSADDTATVAHGDVALAALAVTNRYLCYAAKAQSAVGRDAKVEFKAKFQKPTTSDLPQALDLGQTAVFVFPKGKNSCYKAYTADGWVELTDATPDFTKFVTITIEFRYEYDKRLAMVKIDDVVCTPVDAETPWFALAGSAMRLTCVDFFGAFDLGKFWGDYYARDVKRGFMFIISSAVVAP